MTRHDCHPDLATAARSCRRCATRLAERHAALWAYLAATVPAPAKEDYACAP